MFIFSNNVNIRSCKMNVDVIGRIRPPIRAEGKENLVVEGQRVAAQTTGPFLNFTTLHRKDASNYDVFKHSMENLLELYLAGFNVCLFVMGESEAGKTYTIAGESTNKSGIVPMVFDYLFTKLNEERYMSDTKVRRQNPTVSLEMMEVYNELIKDLLKVPGGGSAAYLELTDSAEKGVHAKNGSNILLRDANDANSVFRQGLARRTEASTDFGPAQNNAATIIHIDLQMIVGDNPHSNRSRFTVVELPGLEKLSDDPSQLRQKEGPVLSKGLISLNSVVTSLASNPYPDRVINYSDSKLTQLLKDELGGNCKTRALLCLKPQTDPHILSSILTFCTRVSQIKNYPILNDSYAQNLITQYRARLLDLQQQSGVGPVPMSKVTNLNDVKDTIRELETENLRLKDENERLRTRLENMQTKFGSLANTKTDLSQQLLMTEEEKLKVSQSLVEMQIENNKIREDAEATKFELTNKILMLENSLMEAENERDKHIKNVKNTKKDYKKWRKIEKIWQTSI
ncbi:hypothetical protein KUTeg_016646 [Tegillarca granosa]|uniref:Kinesin motor domain-containing protein n=1 Tax=Tegillarca granosa TaxID=220873 RepID=A0ABQ9EQB6_TEGGR|nr:hypothetical protein KUTeg_016646 [Tegillarca granosa]